MLTHTLKQTNTDTNESTILKYFVNPKLILFPGRTSNFPYFRVDSKLKKKPQQKHLA